MRSDEKSKEVAIVSRFLARMGVPSARVREHESPDFLVTLPDGSLIGIEVTEPRVAADVFAEIEHTVAAWEQSLRAQGVHGLFKPHFDADVLVDERGQSRKHRREESKAIAAIARSMTAESLVLDSTALRSRGFARLMGLQIERRHDESLLILPGWSSTRAPADPRTLLARKTARVQRWRDQQPEIDAFWLLWAIWPGTFASGFPSDQELAGSGFDRTYQVNASNGRAKLIDVPKSR